MASSSSYSRRRSSTPISPIRGGGGGDGGRVTRTQHRDRDGEVAGDGRSGRQSSTFSGTVESVSCFHCRPSPCAAKPTPMNPAATVEAEHWRLLAVDLSRKLLRAVRKRDEALAESYRLKYALSSLRGGDHRLLDVDAFLRAVAASRMAIRALATHLRSPGNGSVPCHLESVLSHVFFVGFELEDVDEKLHADPAKRCELNLSMLSSVRALTWDHVIANGTRHYSAGLSRFCDEKMAGIAETMTWAPRVWPENLLKAFFAAAKRAFTVRLLARTVHPPVPIIRVDEGALFDSKFMEDDISPATAAVPATVRVMISPGFRIYATEAGVIKCKVLLRQS